METLRRPEFVARLARAHAAARAELLAARNAAGHWEGHLSSSALSTATAVTALTLVQRSEVRSQKSENVSDARSDSALTADLCSLTSAVLRWLAEHQNADGGWGDTVKSKSNISTTTLCWAAFGAVPGAMENFQPAIGRAEQWLTRAAGGLAPEQLAPAIVARYGKDRTFSVPILTMCALAGRLGPSPECWKWVMPLPFEFAAVPHQLYGALRLPVVSYALPALIAIGQVRHHFLPSENFLVRRMRKFTRAFTLGILENIQPSNGGFLEATPLTSFVTMSLAGMGLAAHPVAKLGAEFLAKSARADGSWPIDTNLATWLTTLSVNALLPSRSSRGNETPFSPVKVSLDTSIATAQEERPLPCAESDAVFHWLLNQQYIREHPYTHAAPGGWAWTDLPGGVPDADDTAGAMLALLHLAPDSPLAHEATARGARWLVNLQNRDGGIPTFCRGWGALAFDRSSPDLTAHALRAWLACRPHVAERIERRLARAIPRAVNFLRRTQRADGAWVPLWFGHQDSPDDENPLYGTARVLPALCEVQRAGVADTRELIAAGA
ncbi:MAG: hypothetical protein HY301_09900, partial [Verrucomicrobia bacterium]|nr:hypothetical protein [Verrucomicrobiota bacterium]